MLLQVTDLSDVTLNPDIHGFSTQEFEVSAWCQQHSWLHCY